VTFSPGRDHVHPLNDKTLAESVRDVM
jgi:hypothetical protein